MKLNKLAMKKLEIIQKINFIYIFEIKKIISN